MSKLRAFLDTSIIIAYFRNREDTLRLFSSRVLVKVQYIINPIVYQETILLAKRIGDVDLRKIDEFVDVVRMDKEQIDLRKIREFRNLMVHSNDILILQTAISSECEYLLTLDNDLLEIKKIGPLRILSPGEFLSTLREQE